MRIITKEMIEFENIENDKDLAWGTTYCKTCITNTNKEMKIVEDSKRDKFHEAQLSDEFVKVEFDEISKKPIYYLQTYQERKEKLEGRTTDQKRNCFEKKRKLFELILKRNPNLMDEYQQIKYDLKKIEKEMKKLEIDIPNYYSTQNVKEILIQLVIQTRRKCYAFVRFLGRSDKYKGNATELWNELQKYKINFTAMKILLKNKNYHVVFLKDPSSSLGHFLNDKLNTKDLEQSIWIWPHS